LPNGMSCASGKAFRRLIIMNEKKNLMATESTEGHGKIKSINLIEQTAYDHDMKRSPPHS